MAQTFTVYTAEAFKPYQEAYDEYITDLKAQYNQYAKAKPFVAIAEEVKPLAFAQWAEETTGELKTVADFVSEPGGSF